MYIRGVSFLILQVCRQLKSRIRLLPPPFDDVMKIETDPPSQELTSKPSEQKSSNAAAATALKPPQVPKAGGDESDAHERCVFPDSFKFVN